MYVNVLSKARFAERNPQGYDQKGKLWTKFYASTLISKSIEQPTLQSLFTLGEAN